MRLIATVATVASLALAVPASASASPPAAHRLGRLPDHLTGGMFLVNRTLYVSGGVQTDTGVPTTRLSRVSSVRKVLVQRDFVGIASAPAVADGSLWLTTSSGARGVVQANSGYLFRFDPLTLRRTGRVEVGQGASAPVVGAGSAFVVVDNEVLRVDAATMRITARHTFRTGNGADRWTTLQFSDGWLWVLDDPNGDGPGPTRVLRINPWTMRQSVEITVPGLDVNFAAGSSRLWVVYGVEDQPTRVREVRISTGRTVLDQQLSRIPFAINAVTSDAANNLWYVTRAGALGQVSPDGSREKASIDLASLHPYGVVASTTRVAVSTAAGIQELAPS